MTCPFCRAPAKKLAVLGKDSYGWPVYSMQIYTCGSSVRPTAEHHSKRWMNKNTMPGRRCSAYVSAYPLPPHLAAIHLSEKKPA